MGNNERTGEIGGGIRDRMGNNERTGEIAGGGGGIRM